MAMKIAVPIDGKILECVDRGLDVFGTSVKAVVYWRFQTVYNQERKDILHKPEKFSECLRTFFGERAFSVEAAIVAAINEQLRPNNLKLSDSLTRAITEARNQNGR
jgi:hypothetical protein